MFSKSSRYRKVPDEVTVDVKGRQLLSKSLRQFPTTTGTFLHTISDRDRLDYLSAQYYNQPRKWWQICDANPEFMSPQALLGKTPFITQLFSLSFTDGVDQPRWAELLSEICGLVGVEDVWLENAEKNILKILYNQMNLQSSDLVQTIQRKGQRLDFINLAVSQPQTVERTGKQIVIPPDGIG